MHARTRVVLKGMLQFLVACRMEASSIMLASFTVSARVGDPIHCPGPWPSAGEVNTGGHSTLGV